MEGMEHIEVEGVIVSFQGMSHNSCIIELVSVSKNVFRIDIFILNNK